MRPGIEPDVNSGPDDIEHIVANHTRENSSQWDQQQEAPLLRRHGQHENVNANKQAGSAKIPLNDQQKACHCRHDQGGQDRTQQGDVGLDLVREKGCQVDNDQEFQRLRGLEVQTKRLQPQLRSGTRRVHTDEKCQTDQQQADQQPDVFITLQQVAQPVGFEPQPKDGATHRVPTELL